MNHLEKAIKERRAIRKFKPDDVPRELLDKAFDLVRWLPVIDAFHSWDYFVIQGANRDIAVDLISKNTTHLRDLLDFLGGEMRDKALAFYPDLGGAPVLILLTVREMENAWEKKLADNLSGMSLYLLMLALHQVGLASCGVTISPWIENKLMERFQIEGRDVICAIAVGFPDEKPKPPSKAAERVTYL